MLDGGIGFKFWIWFYGGTPVPHGVLLLIGAIVLVVVSLCWPSKTHHR